jgi:tRNA G10  N-methylase Trm11
MVEEERFLYTFACHEDEIPLCRLEQRILFAAETNQSYLLSPRRINVSRSPFVKHRLEIMYEAYSLQELVSLVEEIQLQDATFKVVYIEADKKPDYQEQREIEREIGLHIRGKAEMREPKRLFGVTQLSGRWLFGGCTKNQAVWLQHNEKPQSYSTALSTRVARAIANIAVPEPAGIKAIDPCCGVGTVVIEALSMGIDIAGYDINPLAVRGARANLAYFGLPSSVAIGDVRSLSGSYNAAILDLPYNLCSKLSQEERRDMLFSVRRLASKAVVIATEPLDEALTESGFKIVDQCVVFKSRFARYMFVCR